MIQKLLVSPDIQYPESDGKPMAEHTRQAQWISTIHGNLDALYQADPQVFVAIDNLWYPVEGFPKICQAPDVYVVFGRPKRHRGAYKQWEEDDLPPQVVFEILSPANTGSEMLRKEAFYDEYGVEEYYIYDPEDNSLTVYLRRAEMLIRERFRGSFISPRMRIRFDLTGAEMAIFYPDGRRFLTFEQLEADRTRNLQRAEKAEQQVARLSELTRKLLANQATPEEIAELLRLTSEPT